MTREWMYKRRSRDGSLNPDFIGGVDSFIAFACNQPMFMDREKIRCPCTKCDNMKFQADYDVRYHLVINGFVRNYEVWRYQGETIVQTTEAPHFVTDEIPSSYHDMVMDHA